MTQNSVLDVPLSQVMRPEIALPLQHVLQIYTVGNFLRAWRNPKNHKNIEPLFDTPQQALLSPSCVFAPERAAFLCAADTDTEVSRRFAGQRRALR